MKSLELRRHSTRRQGTEHLSQEGVTLARQIGVSMGPFTRVICSPSSWTYETAIAMGYAVDEQYAPVPFTDEEYQELDRIMPPESTFRERSYQMRTHPLGRRYAEALKNQWEQVAVSLEEGEAALVITHGGYIDCSAVACLPSADHGAWGPNFGHCEGIRLEFDQTGFEEGMILRTDSVRL